MAKQNCAICGAEVNLIQQQKLADGNFICRKVCAKRTMKDFDLVHASLPEVQAHIKQFEEGTELYNRLLKPLKRKLKWPHGTSVAVAEDLGLMAKTEHHHKILIFGKTTSACVFRIADLYGYEYESGTKVVAGNAAAGQKGNTTQAAHFIHYSFWDTPGWADFVVPVSSRSTFNSAEKYYNKLFGIQKTVGNIKNTWKNQIDAVKAGAGAVKAMAGGDEDAAAKTHEAAAAIDRMQYGDRSEWIAKAEAALRG